MNAVSHLSRWISPLATLFLFLATQVVVMAADPEVLFEDDYSTLDSSLNSVDNIDVSVEKNELKIACKATWSYSAFYQSSLFDDIDMSIRVKLNDPNGEKGAIAGIGFWVTSYREYYMLAISDSGTVGVYSSDGKRFIYPVPWRQTDALKTGANDWNVLRVVTVGNWAMVYVNGKKLASFKGKPPTGGSLLGPYYSPGSEDSVGRFSNLKIVVPSGPDAIVPKEDTDPSVIYRDDFFVLDPGWGVENGKFFAKNNTLTLKPDADGAQRSFYQSLVTNEMDATVKIRVGDGDPASVCSGGIIFWGVTLSDYFLLTLNDNGQVSCYRLTGQRWLTPMASKVPPTEAKVKTDGLNELRVVTSGKKATVYVNGVSVGTISNPQAKGDWQFGVYGDSGKAPGTIEFQSLLVRKPTP